MNEKTKTSHLDSMPLQQNVNASIQLKKIQFITER